LGNSYYKTKKCNQSFVIWYKRWGVIYGTILGIYCGRDPLNVVIGFYLRSTVQRSSSGHADGEETNESLAVDVNQNSNETGDDICGLYEMA
jgi:hypothetical protein